MVKTSFGSKETMTKTPLPHQLSGAEYLNKRGSGFLWIGMRGGKSFTALLSKADQYPLLILGPLTVLAGWVDELLDYGFSRDEFKLIRGNFNQKLNHLRSDLVKVYLINYDVAKALDVGLCRTRSERRSTQGIFDFSLPRLPFPLDNWKTIIFDESYCLSNEESGRTKYWLEQPIPEGQHRVALSGLPATESIMNFASQYMIVDGHFMGYTNIETYMATNWIKNPWDNKWEPAHPYHVQQVMDYVKANSFIVTMEEIHSSYQGEVYTIWEVEQTKEQKHLLEWVDEALAYRYPHETPEDEAHPMLSAVRFSFGMQVASGVNPLTKEKVACKKADYIVEWYRLHKLPAVVLSSSKTGLLFLAERLSEEGISFKIVHGGTSISDRGIYREQFQAGEFDLFLAQTTTVKMGYNLSRADHIFHYSNTFSCDTRGQADKRCTHLDKKSPVQIIDLCIEGTRERELTMCLRDKQMDARSWIGKPMTFRMSI